MPNYNSLVYTAADYKLFLSIPNGAVGGSYPLKTTDSISFNTTVEEEQGFAVGEMDAIFNKQNARKRAGKLVIQVGEMGSIMQIEGLLDATFINGAVLAAAVIQGAWNKTWKQVNFNSEDIDIKGKDKQSLMVINFTAIDAV